MQRGRSASSLRTSGVRRRGPPRVLPRANEVSDVSRDPLGIPPDAGQHVGRDRVLEDQTDEAETRLGLDHATVVPRLPVLVEDREVDPGEVLAEAGAPDDVRYVEDAVVLEQRQTVARADDAAASLDARVGEVFRLDADQRRSL